MIFAPFANYRRATLERLVQEGFESIERGAVLGPQEFQRLCAAKLYLRQTKEASSAAASASANMAGDKS